MDINENAQKESDGILQAIDVKLEAFKLDILNEVSNLLDEKLKITLSNNEEVQNILNYPIPNLSYYKSIKNGAPIKGEGKDSYGSLLHTISYMMNMLERIEQQVQDIPANLKYYHDTIARIDTYVYDIEDTVLNILSLIETVFFYNSEQIVDRFDDYQTRAFLQHWSPDVKEKISKNFSIFKKEAIKTSDERTDTLDSRLQTKKVPAIEELIKKTIEKSLETLEERIAIRKI